MLRDSATPAEVLRRIGRDRRWTRRREIRRALVQHAKTPLAVSRAMLPFLYRNDLIELARDLRAQPTLRRHAETLLGKRVEEMTLGERVSLARQATAGVIPALVEDGHSRVLRSLLDNKRLTEDVAVEIASARCADGALLEYFAICSPWSRRPAVSLALLGNRRTPVSAALRLIARLAPRELARVAGDAGFPRIVRIGASRRLAQISRTRQRTDAANACEATRT